MTGTIQTVELDDYMLERLQKYNKEMYPEEGEDLTIAIGMLISENIIYHKIKGMIH